MSDADDQMGGHGGETGKDPDEATDEAPDPVTGNMGKGKPTGEGQAEENAENDPPA